jgi:dephospho-CoA kinase
MKPFALGLTGSIGMGKSTTASLFAAEGIPVWDADAAVHALYSPNGAAAKVLAQRFPAIIEADGSVSRPKLRDAIQKDPTLLDEINRIVHPLVRADRAEFLSKTHSDIVLLDIPLLYETGADAECDAVLVVTAPAAIQKSRVLARGQMTEIDFALILKRQMPDAEKRARATHIVETLSHDSTQAYVRALIAHIRQGLNHA